MLLIEEWRKLFHYSFFLFSNYKILLYIYLFSILHVHVCIVGNDKIIVHIYFFIFLSHWRIIIIYLHRMLNIYTIICIALCWNEHFMQIIVKCLNFLSCYPFWLAFLYLHSPAGKYTKHHWKIEYLYVSDCLTSKHFILKYCFV